MHEVFQRGGQIKTAFLRVCVTSTLYEPSYTKCDIIKDFKSENIFRTSDSQDINFLKNKGEGEFYTDLI